jgi:hypothetical protein
MSSSVGSSGVLRGEGIPSVLTGGWVDSVVASDSFGRDA